jgi:hypothetical protein
MCRIRNKPSRFRVPSLIVAASLELEPNRHLRHVATRPAIASEL